MTTTAPAAGNVKLTSAATDALRDLATAGPARSSDATTPRDDGRWINTRVAKTLVAKGYAYRILDGDDLGITPAGCEYLGVDFADVELARQERDRAAGELDLTGTPDTATTEELDDEGDADVSEPATAVWTGEGLTFPDGEPATLLGDDLPPAVDRTTGEIDPPTPSALAPPARYVIEIPLDDLHPAPTNRTPRDLDGLAASIATDGVLQPLLVRRDGTKYGFEIIAGARRHAAARLAGKSTVPCLVEDAAADTVKFHRLVENLQRADLTPLEEADAFAELVTEFKLTQADIAARVGYSEAHVSKRLSLRTLPDEAKAALDDGRINIQTALGITSLTKTPDRLDIVVAALPDVDDENETLERHRQELDRVLAAQIRQADTDRLRARVTAELEKAGDKVIPYPKFGAWSIVKGNWRPCRAGEEPEAFSVNDDGHAVKITTQPLPEAQRHAPSVPGAKKPTKPKHETDEQRAAREAQEAALALLDEQRADAAERRRAAARAALRKVGSDTALTAYLLDTVLTPVLDDDEILINIMAKDVVDLLADEIGSDPDDPADDEVLLRAYADGAIATRWRAALAAVLVDAEELFAQELDAESRRGGAAVLQPGQFARDPNRPNRWTQRGEPRLVRYFEVLQQYGYKPTDEELSALTSPAAS